MTERRTQATPTRTSIAVGVLLTLASLFWTGWIIWGAQSGREYAGFWFGFLASVMLFGQTVGQVARYRAARDPELAGGPPEEVPLGLTETGRCVVDNETGWCLTHQEWEG